MYKRSATITVIFVFFIFLLAVCVSANCPNGFFNNSLGCIRCPVHCRFCNTSEFCFSCEEGFSGQKCQFSCSNCKLRTECDQDSGICKEGCKDGFSGVHCEDVCDNKCQSCDRYNPTKCLTCKNNQTCEEVCPVYCLSKKCVKKKCTDGCLSGYWGDSCEKNCPLTCSKGVCDRENGTCSEAADEPPLLDTSRLIVAIPSVLLVMMTGVVIYLICRQRNHRSSTGNGPEEVTVGMIDIQTLPTDCDTYHLPSEPPDDQPTGEKVSSYMSPVHIAEEQKHQYGGILNQDYIPLSTTEHSDNQYKQITTAASAAPMSG